MAKMSEKHQGLRGRMLLVMGLALITLASGCRTVMLRKAQDAYCAHDLQSAREYIDEYVLREGNGVDRVIAHLEQGTIRRSLGDLTGSNNSFEIVDEALAAFDEAADFSLSREALSVVTNLNSLPYRGYSYDRIMLNTYRAINFLEMGERDAARVELRRAYERQSEAVQRNAKRIEKAEQAASTSDDGRSNEQYDLQRANQDPAFQNSLRAQYAGLDKYEAYSNYVNPFTEWLQGLYYLSEARDGSDLERARKSMERVVGMVPENPYLLDDLAVAEDVAAGGDVPATTYVVFCTGTAPKRGEVRIDIPLFLVSGDVDYVGVNFPRLVPNDYYLAELTVHAGSDAFSTSLLCDMDAVVGQEFRNELPIVIARTLLSAGTKAAIAYALKEATKNETTLVSSGTRILTTLFQAAMNQADLRTWVSLPKQFQYARLRTPNDKRIQVVAPGHAPIDVDLHAGTTNVVMVRSINASAPLEVSQFSLGKGARSWPTASTTPSR